MSGVPASASFPVAPRWKLPRCCGGSRIQWGVRGAGCGPGTLVRAASRPGGQPVCSNHVHVSVAPMELCCELGVNLVYQHGARIEQFADFAKTKLGTH